MSGQNHIPFFEMFSCCRDTALLTGTLENTVVVSATVDKSKLAMKLSLLLPSPIAPIDITMIEDGIKTEFGLSSVVIMPLYPRSMSSGKNTSNKSEKKLTKIQ